MLENFDKLSEEPNDVCVLKYDGDIQHAQRKLSDITTNTKSLLKFKGIDDFDIIQEGPHGGSGCTITDFS